MTLDRVVIEDFKSIKKLNIQLHDITCLIGKNESGKSAILEAISYLNFSKYKLSLDKVNKSSERYDNDKLSCITGYFALNEVDIQELEPKILGASKDGLKTQSINTNFKWLRVIVNGENVNGVEIEFVYGNNKYIRLSSLYDEHAIYEMKNYFLNDYIPYIELFNNDSLTLNPITLQQLQSKEDAFESFNRLFRIGGVNEPENLTVNNIEKLDDKLSVIGVKITDLLQKNYSQDKNLSVEVKYVGNQFLLKFKDSSKRTFNINERSLGFQYFFAFLINKTFLNKFHHKKHIFLLDEPGVSLHPEGARDLIRVFEDIAKTDQVVYTTHNPFLAFRKKPDNLILVKKNEAEGTELLTKTYTNKYQILRKELGLLLNDSFLINDINIVVEGNSDKFLLHYVIHEDEELEPLTWAHIFSADTVTDVIPSVRYLNSLGLKGIVLTDSDAAALTEIRKPKFKTHITDQKGWSYTTLNQILNDNEERVMEDMLPPAKYIESYNNYYLENLETIEWENPFEPLTTKDYNISILNQIKIHFKDYNKGEINKIAIFRKFTQLFPYENNLEDYKNLKDLLIFTHSEIGKLN